MPPLRCPPLYTQELLTKAKDYLLETEECVCSTQACVDGMIAANILPAGTNAASLWAVLRPYMREQGLQLVYGS